MQSAQDRVEIDHVLENFHAKNGVEVSTVLGCGQFIRHQKRQFRRLSESLVAQGDRIRIEVGANTLRGPLSANVRETSAPS